jgi:hypothetical protein
MVRKEPTRAGISRCYTAWYIVFGRNLNNFLPSSASSLAKGRNEEMEKKT